MHDPTNLTPSHPSVDLDRARNYIPAAVCVGKAGVLLGCLCLAHSVGFAPGYVLLVLATIMDRLISTPRIFDANSLLLALLCADIVQRLRESPDAWWHLWPYVWYSASAAWAVFGLYSVLGHTGGRTPLCMGFLITACFVGLIAMCHSPEEAWVFRLARGLTFTVLSVLWVYIAGIHHRRLAAYQDSGVHFVINFSPVLFIHPYVALLFGVVALQCVAAGVGGAGCDPGGVLVLGMGRSKEDPPLVVAGGVQTSVPDVVVALENAPSPSSQPPHRASAPTRPVLSSAEQQEMDMLFRMAIARREGGM